MIKDKISPELIKRFLQEIKKSKEIDIERGFHICIEKDGKLSAGDTCIGDKCSLRFPQPKLPKDWVLPLFDKEMINLKKVRKDS